MVKRIHKFATGDKVPEGARYLNTVAQTETESVIGKTWYKCWLVWHYYEVEVKE